MQKDNYIFEKANLDDVNKIYEIEKESFTNPWSIENIKSELEKEDSYVFVCKLDENILGYISSSIIEDEAYLLNVAVKKDYRNQKIATRLFQNVFDLCESSDVNFITLEVRKSNSAAINLYTKLGFNNVGIRHNYYRKPVDDAVLMTKYFIG